MVQTCDVYQPQILKKLTSPSIANKSEVSRYHCCRASFV